MERDQPEGSKIASLLAAMRAGGEPRFPDGHGAERLIARARAAIGCERPRLASLEVVAAANGLVPSSSGQRAGEVMSPLVLRGGADGGCLVRHELGGREVATAVHRSAHGRFAVVLDLGVDADRRGVRVTLERHGRELSSELARQGRVALPEVSEGRFRIRLEDRGGWIGDIDLALIEGTEAGQVDP